MEGIGMKIAFYLLDKTDNKVKKVYFSKWQGNIPIFVSDKNNAKKYWREELAEQDVELLNKATSKQSLTLNIKLEVAE